MSSWAGTAVWTVEALTTCWSLKSHMFLFDLSPALSTMADVKALVCVYRQCDVTQRRTACGYSSLSAYGQRVDTPKLEEALFNRDIDLSSLIRLLLEESNPSYCINSRGTLRQSDVGAADTFTLEPTKHQKSQNILQPLSQNHLSNSALLLKHSLDELCRMLLMLVKLS